MIPKLDPNPVAHAYDREMQAARMAETWEVAMERLACRESNACGPNQLDSVIFCARHNICRDGFSVNDGLRELFSQRVLGDADLIVAEVLRQRSELGLD